MLMLNTTQIPLKFYNSLTKSIAVQCKYIPLHPVSIINRTVKTVKRLKIIKIILLIMCITTSIAGRVTAQDSIRTQNFPDYYENSFQKRQLSLGVFWRNFVSEDLGKWGAGLNYKLNDGTSSEVYTIGLAAHVIFNITPGIGIVTGLEIANYSGKAAGNFEEAYTFDLDAMQKIQKLQKQEDGNYLDFTCRLRDYREQQKLALFSVPVMVKFTTPAFTDVNMKYFVAFGFKLGIPLIDRVTIDPGYVSTSGHFSRENETYPSGSFDFPEHGWVTGARGFNAESKMGIKLGVSLALETGVTFMSNEDISAAASIYYDFGLSSMIRRDSRNMVEYYPEARNYEHLGFNSIMRTDRASSVVINSLGLKLTVNFNLDKKPKQPYSPY
jgi:hypothetical protein